MIVRAAMINQWCTDVHKKMCGYQALKCGEKILPSQISLGRKVCFLLSGLRKISLGGKFWAMNSDCPLDGMSHDSPLL